MGAFLSRVCLILCGLFLTAPATPSQIVVSHLGDDNSAGTFADPFATPARAQLEVRKLRKQYPDRGVTVLLRSGIYRLTETIAFGPEDGGGPNAEVIWAALPGEYVTFSGGIELNEWKQDENGHLRAKVPSALAKLGVSDVYSSRQRLPLARHPNEGWLRVKEVGEDRRTSFTFDPQLADLTLENADGLLVQLLHDRSTSRIPVAEIDSAEGTLRTRTPIGCEAPHYAINNFEAHPRFLLEGHLALLDKAGEWAIDPSTGELVVMPPQPLPELVNWAATEETMHAVVPFLERMIEIKGTAKQPVQNLRFFGITFRHSRFTPPADGWAGAQASMHERRDGSEQERQRIFTPAAVQMEFAQNCSMERCHFYGLGGSAIWIGRACIDVGLRLCFLSDIGANGINVGEDYARQIDGKPWWRSSDLSDPELARRVFVEGCSIGEVGARYGGSVGIWIGFAADCSIAFNQIRNTPYTGLSVGWVWGQDPAPSGGHLIERNEIGNVMQLLSDGGCIYTLGKQPGTVIRNNELHNVPRHAGRAPSNGIFIDEGSSEILFDGNQIYDIGHAPIRFHRAGKNRVVGNALITSMESPYYYNRTNADDIEFIDNLVSETRTAETMGLTHEVGPRWYLWSLENHR